MAAEGVVDVVITPITEPVSTTLTFEAVIDRLRDRDAQMNVDERNVLRYVGPPLDADDPVRLALSEQHERLVERCTLRLQGRCVIAACDLPRVEGYRHGREMQRQEDEFKPPIAFFTGMIISALSILLLRAIGWF